MEKRAVEHLNDIKLRFTQFQERFALGQKYSPTNPGKTTLGELSSVNFFLFL